MLIVYTVWLHIPILLRSVQKNPHTIPLFKQSSTLKFQDQIFLENISFVRKFLNNWLLSVVKTWFSFSSGQHNYESSTQGNLF